MSREDLVAVGLRLFAIYLLVNLLKQVPGLLQVLSEADDTGLSAFFAGLVLAGLLVCALLWVFPLTVARRLLPAMKEPRSEQSMDAGVALAVGLTLIGVWVLAYGLVDAMYWLTLVVRTRQLDADYFEWGHEQIAYMVSTGAELVIAMWLILGSSGIRRLIQRYRYGKSSEP